MDIGVGLTSDIEQLRSTVLQHGQYHQDEKWDLDEMISGERHRWDLYFILNGREWEERKRMIDIPR